MLLFLSWLGMRCDRWLLRQLPCVAIPPPSLVNPLRVVVVDDDDEECACVTNGPDYFYCLFALILPSCVCVFPFMFSFSFLPPAASVCVRVRVFVCGFAHLCVTNKFSKINKDNNPFECAAIELFTAIAHFHIGCPLPRFALVSGQHTISLYIRAALNSTLCVASGGHWRQQFLSRLGLMRFYFP